MISSNYDSIITRTQKTDFGVKKESNLFDLLKSSIQNRVDNATNKFNSTDVISKDNLDEILLKANSFNFISALTNTSKKPYDKYDKYDKYKNEKNDYSFLYNDFNLKYQELIYKHKQLENITKNINK